MKYLDYDSVLDSSMALMSVALDTSQDPIFSLKSNAYENIALMSVILDTSHIPRSNVLV
jgi:hypothetical protein